jgi:acyl-coenzyme A synthetase/AMP-(fatty) acid ligase
LDLAELRAFARQRLAPFKVPNSIERVEALPRGGSGKLLRGELR